MANYTILNDLVSAQASTDTVVTLIPNYLTSDTAGGTIQTTYTKGQVISDTLLGGAGPVTRFLALKAIQ